MRIVRSLSVLLLATSVTVARPAAAANWVNFFEAENKGYEAYIDLSDRTRDAAGFPLVSVRLESFSAAFRDWIEHNFPKGGTAAYGVDPYSVDCATRRVGEHHLVWYDSNGFPLADYDFGGQMQVPNTGTMKFWMLKKICDG